MKLLLCKKCFDVVSLVTTKRTCACKKTGGKYLDEARAVYFGKYAVPIGFSNPSLILALSNQPVEGMGEDFTAFVMPKKSLNYKLVLEGEC